MGSCGLLRLVPAIGTASRPASTTNLAAAIAAFAQHGHNFHILDVVSMVGYIVSAMAVLNGAATFVDHLHDVHIAAVTVTVTVTVIDAVTEAAFLNDLDDLDFADGTMIEATMDMSMIEATMDMAMCLLMDHLDNFDLAAMAVIEATAMSMFFLVDDLNNGGCTTREATTADGVAAAAEVATAATAAGVATADEAGLG